MRRSGSVYVVRLQARPGADGIRALRATLKALWRHHRIRCLDVREVREEKAAASRQHLAPQKDDTDVCSNRQASVS
jgi:hypothetical protein